MARHASPLEQTARHPLDAIVEGVHRTNDIYQATIDKAAIPGHEFETEGPRGMWARIGIGVGQDLVQLGQVEDGEIVAVRNGTVMPGDAVLGRYATRHRLDGIEAAEEQLARLRVLAAGTYIEQDETPDGPRVVAFGIGGHEQVAPKTELSLKALKEAGYVSTASVLGKSPRIPGQLSPTEVLLRHDTASNAPDDKDHLGEVVDTTGRQIDPSSRFSDWNASVIYWERRALQEQDQGVPPALGDVALRD